MRTAVDSSVLLDVFAAQEPFFKVSGQALRQAIQEGSLIAGDVVWAEVRAHFPSDGKFLEVMATLGVSYQAALREAALEAGRAWIRYRKRGGQRKHLIADFLVAAHALVQAERLLTRDRGFSRYFPQLKIWDPGRPG